MASTPVPGQGLSLYDAARQMGVPFTQENEPVDRFVEVNGMSFHYLEWGDGASPTVLLLHGASQQAHSWDFVSLALSGQYHVLALDQRGHGDSDWAPQGDYSIEAHQRDIDGFVQACGLSAFVLIGHSMGGRNSYVWASRHPGTLKGLVIVDTGPETHRRGQDRIRQFRELPDELDSFEDFVQRVQEYTGRSQEQVLGALKYSIRQRSDGKWTWKYDKIMRTSGRGESGWTPQQLWECVSSIDCPTLVVRGSRSDLFLEETMQRMQEVISDCTTVTISGAGHLVQGDNPVDFVAATQELLSRVV
jgi:pimeloyl-ACP methyl ester carboxylesterase